MKKLIIYTLLFVGMSLMARSQEIRLEQIGVGETMGDFTLRSYQGDSFSMANLRGQKNVLLIFPRGKVLDNLWCPICYYQYAEMAAYAEKENLAKKFDLEILYILPYPKDSVVLWHKAAENGLNTIEKWKIYEGYESASENAKRWANYVREFFPEKYDLKGNKMDLPIPVLMDEDASVSNSLALYKEEWGGTKTWQNIPTIYLLDKKGTLKFKYHSQYTNDRPLAKYIGEMLKKLL